MNCRIMLFNFNREIIALYPSIYSTGAAGIEGKIEIKIAYYYIITINEVKL